MCPFATGYFDVPFACVFESGFGVPGTAVRDDVEDDRESLSSSERFKPFDTVVGDDGDELVPRSDEPDCECGC